MADAQKYAEWLVANEDKRGTPEFETVANAYKAARDSMGEEPQAAPRQNPAFTPELVAGTQQQMAEQRARNLQGSLGLSDPVSPGDSVPITDRILSGFAPTPEEKSAYYQKKYGEAPIPISPDQALVKVGDGKGGSQWVVDNPTGLDVGDVAQLSSNIPAMVAGVGSAMAMAPGPAGPIARLSKASGVTALAGNAVGAAQDAAYRYLTDTPINAVEIAQRRGLGAALETVAGIVLPVTVGGAVQRFRAGRAVTDFLKNFDKSTKDAAQALKDAGVDVKASGEVADAVRSLNPSKASPGEIGDAIAGVLNQQDAAIRKGAGRMAGMALNDAGRRAEGIIGAATKAAPEAPADAGLAAIGAAKLRIEEGQKAVDSLYKQAYQQIGEAVDKAGGDPHIVSLTETKKTVDSLVGNVMRAKKTVEGVEVHEPSDAFAPLLTQLRQIDEATSATQKLDAARQARTMLGERIRGRGGVFSDLNDASAKQLYGALSSDIDRSVAAYSGPGANALKAANASYKAMVEVVDNSPLIDKLVNNGFANPEDVVQAMVKGGTGDWAAAKSVLTPNVYASLRRSVLGELTGEGQGNKLVQFGREVLDVPALNTKLSSMDAAVKNEIFGGEAPWRALQKIGAEYDFVLSRGGLFTKPALPSVNEIMGATDIARSQGLDAANKYIGKAIAAASARRNGMAESFLAQARSGNMDAIVRDPESFLRAVVFNGEVRPEYIASAVKKLPADTRDKIANVAFQEIFETTRQAGESMLSKKGSYDVDAAVKLLFGDKKRTQVLTDILGPNRMELLTNWARYEVGTIAASKAASVGGKRIAGLISTAPYQNLFAARLASMALEKASGSHLLGNLTHDKAMLFRETRRIMTQPKQTAAQIAVMQRAMNTQGFSDYVDMLNGFTPEQQEAIDGYLTRSP